MKTAEPLVYYAVKESKLRPTHFCRTARPCYGLETNRLLIVPRVAAARTGMTIPNTMYRKKLLDSLAGIYF
jgi:hypothetical protein